MSGVPDRLAAALAARYRLERALGQGGMATVYLAEDLRHDRKVAVKVLKPELAAVLGAERFVVEIKTTAALSHPHILPLFDSGSADGFLYYVMPYVEGETLRAKLDRETQLGVEEAVKLTVAIADALDYAHRHGVIHRDIKPENILLHDGRPMVADFGIALALSAAAGGRMTETGLSLGTPHYMSPEQATAEKEITARSDVYSLASVLYEMLAGQPPHLGGSAQQIIMKIIAEPARPVAELRKSVPPGLSATLAKALEKLPADRFASAAEFAAALAAPEGATALRAVARPGHPGRRGQALAVAGLGGMAVVATALAAWALLRAPTPAPLRQWNLVLPDSAPLDFFAPSVYGEGQPALALSRAGDQVAYVARWRGTSQLFLRRLDGLEARPLPGTEGASQPFFSPDGEWVGFIAGGEVKKVAVAGGAPVALARVSAARGAAWTSDGRIVLGDADREGRVDVLPAAGGARTPVPGCTSTLYWPALLPDERWVVGSTADRRLVLCSLVEGRTLVLAQEGPVPLEAADGATLLRGSYPRYVPSGHLLYLVGSTLTALPFDPEDLEVLGPPAPVRESVRRESWDAAGQFAVADDGTLVVAPGTDAARAVLVWVAPTGRVADTLPLPAGDYFNIFASPTGRHVAFSAYQPTGQVSLSLFDAERGLVQEVPLETEVRLGSWWPDGEHIILYSFPGAAALTWQQPGRRAAAGEGSWRVALDARAPRDSLTGPNLLVNDVSPDLRTLAVRRYGDSAGVLLMDREGSRLLQPGGGWPVFSPDGRWIAFASPAGPRIAPVAVEGPVVTVGSVAGDEPEWAPDGEVLYYRAGARWMAVDIDARAGLRAGKPRLLFEGRYLNVRSKSWDVGRDGRFLLLLGPPEETVAHLDVLTGSLDEFKRLAPRGRP